MTVLYGGMQGRVTRFAMGCRQYVQAIGCNGADQLVGIPFFCCIDQPIGKLLVAVQNGAAIA
ncbi:hypothetical protein GCM10023116_21420 [Kistimonas scapharcae]|uniref:Uncharacterized protein n=1 Tax=Kistimonas scapharcae TaxID=1036133 RepID=A0ABP8V251_9GAMM